MQTNARALRLYYFVAFAALGVFMPYQPIWLVARGIEGWRMGLVVALRPIAMIVAPVVFGLLADRFGIRGQLMRWAGFATLLTVSLLTIAYQFGELSFFAVLFAFLMFSLVRVPMLTMADVATLECGQHYGGVRLWGSLGFMLVSVGAGYWLRFEHPTPYLLSISVLMLGAFLVSFAVPSTRSVPVRAVVREATQLLRRPRFRLFLGVVFGWQLAHSGYDLCISLHLQVLGATGTQVGLAWGVATLAEVFVMARAAGALRQWGALQCLTVGLFVAALRWLLLAVTRSLPLVLALQPLHAFSFGLVWVAAMGFVRGEADARLLASAQGMTAACMAMGTTVGMVAWAAVNQSLGARPVFMLAAAISVGAALLLGRAVWGRSGPRA